MANRILEELKCLRLGYSEGEENTEFNDFFQLLRINSVLSSVMLFLIFTYQILF